MVLSSVIISDSLCVKRGYPVGTCGHILGCKDEKEAEEENREYKLFTLLFTLARTRTMSV